MEQNLLPAADDSIDTIKRNTSAIEDYGDGTSPEAIPADTEDIVAELKNILADAKVIGGSPGALTRASVLADTLFKRLTSCPICYQTLVNPETTPCGHSFCKVCLDTWLSRSNSCPACRRTIPSAAADPNTAEVERARGDVLQADEVLGPYRLRLQDVLSRILPPPQANTDGGNSGTERQADEEIRPEAVEWLEGVYTNVDAGLQHIAIRAKLHAATALAGNGVSESVKWRARQHLQSVEDGMLLLEQGQADQDVLDELQPAELRERIELDAMALAWMALQLLHTGRIRSNRRERERG